MERYRLDELEGLAAEIGFVARRIDALRLDVELAEELVLSFVDATEPEPPRVGFEGTGWRAWGAVTFATGRETSVTWDELEILRALARGDLVVVTRYKGDALDDRWLGHDEHPFDHRDMKSGEELVITRIDMSVRPNDS